MLLGVQGTQVYKHVLHLLLHKFRNSLKIRHLSLSSKMSELQPKFLHKSLNSILDVLNEPKHKTSKAVMELLSVYNQVYDEENSKQINISTKKYPLIVLEGLDGSGKSTATKRLAEYLNIEYCVTPPTCLHGLRHLFDDDKELREIYYTLGNYIAALQIETTLRSKPVVLDRFWHSTASYALAQAVADFPDKYCLPNQDNPIYEWPSDLLKPDLVFFLDVKEEIRLNRLKNRTTFTAQERLLQSEPEFRMNVIKAFKCIRNPSLTCINAMFSKKKTQLNIMQHMRPIMPPDFVYSYEL